MVAVKEDTKVLIVATIAWGLRKCSRPIMLLLIFLIAMKPGLIHAVYSMSKSEVWSSIAFTVFKIFFFQ